MVAGGENVLCISVRTKSILEDFLTVFRGTKIVRVELSEAPPSLSKTVVVGDSTTMPAWSDVPKILHGSHKNLIATLEELEQKIVPDRRTLETAIETPGSDQKLVEALRKFDIKQYHELLSGNVIVPLALLTMRESNLRPESAYLVCNIQNDVSPCLRIGLSRNPRNPLKLEADNLRFEVGLLVKPKNFKWPVKVTMKQTARQAWAINVFKKVIRALDVALPPLPNLTVPENEYFYWPDGSSPMSLHLPERQNLVILMFADFWERSEFRIVDKKIDLLNLKLLNRTEETDSSIATKIGRLMIKIEYDRELGRQR